MEQEKEFSVINIAETLLLIRHYMWILIATTVAFAFVAFIGVKFLTNDTYTATGVLYVSNISNKNTSGDIVGSIQKSDIDTSKTISTTYIELLKTRDFLETVSDKLNNTVSWSEIKQMLKISSIGDTELLRISVTAGSAEDSFRIAQSIIYQAPEKLLQIYDGGKVDIADNVYKPSAPDDKNLMTKIMFSGILGAVLGLFIIFAINFFDRKIHNGSDISKKYKASVLGEISNGNIATSTKRGSKNNIGDGTEKILSKDTSFDVAETYKSIRTNIMFSTTKTESGKIILITSSCPGEGKTTTSINMAITFAQTGAKVILVDCDLRKSRVHRYLQLDRKSGVSNVVCGYTKLDDAIQTGVREHLDVLTAGEIPPNPAELLGTTEFKNLLEQLKERYDYIFVDTPPLTVVTDASIIMNNCNGTIIVARENMTTFDMLDVSMSEIARSGTKLLGVILLDSTERQKKYGYYKTNKYGNKYGYKYKYDYTYGDDTSDKR